MPCRDVPRIAAARKQHGVLTALWPEHRNLRGVYRTSLDNREEDDATARQDVRPPMRNFTFADIESRQRLGISTICRHAKQPAAT